MTARTRRTWKPNARGYYERQIGWTRTKNGKLQQPKFLLGTDRKVAHHRERKLCELWEQAEQTQQGERPEWPAELLKVARKVAKGATEVLVAREPDEWAVSYVNRIRRLQRDCPVVGYMAEDIPAFKWGQMILDRSKELPETDPELTDTVPFDLIPPSNDTQTVSRAKILDTMEKVGYLPLTDDFATAKLHDNSILAGLDRIAIRAPPEMNVAEIAPAGKITAKEDVDSPPSNDTQGCQNALADPPTPCQNATLHDALRAYETWLKKEFFEQSLGHVSDWGKTQLRQAARLLKHHEDCPLSSLDYDGVEKLVQHWRQRPIRNATGKPIAVESAKNHISQLKRFLKWLARTSQFEWRKPEGFEDINARPRTLPSDHQKTLEQVATFSREELVLLMRYGQPMDRLLLLLGLNCAFGMKEIATLRVREVELRKAHSSRHQEVMDFKTTDEDSFIKRIRHKNGVYGEFILFPMTVQAIEWVLKRRKSQSGFSDDAILILNDNGEPLDNPTKGGNRNQQIPNRFDRLIRRVQDDGNEINKLSFGKLRKTAADLVRRFSHGEVMAVFQCHGRAVKTDNLADVYSNRPFGKVFKAIRDVERYLAPVFKAAGPHPFDPQPQAYTKRKTIDRIIKLHEDGYLTGQIARAVGMSGKAVSQHIQRYKQEQQAAPPPS